MKTLAIAAAGCAVVVAAAAAAVGWEYGNRSGKRFSRRARKMKAAAAAASAPGSAQSQKQKKKEKKEQDDRHAAEGTARRDGTYFVRWLFVSHCHIADLWSCQVQQQGWHCGCSTVPTDGQARHTVHCFSSTHFFPTCCTRTGKGKGDPVPDDWGDGSDGVWPERLLRAETVLGCRSDKVILVR